MNVYFMIFDTNSQPIELIITCVYTFYNAAGCLDDIELILIELQSSHIPHGQKTCLSLRNAKS